VTIFQVPGKRVTLDMQENELRDMTTEIRIVKDLGTHARINGLPVLTDAELASPEVLDPVTVAYVAPKKYPTGTLTFEHTFRENGKFIGVVTVKNSHGQTYVSQFPFSVGQMLGNSLFFYGLMVLAAIAGACGIWRYSRDHAATPPKKAA
jgi:hypothetical protein